MHSTSNLTNFVTEPQRLQEKMLKIECAQFKCYVWNRSKFEWLAWFRCKSNTRVASILSQLISFRFSQSTKRTSHKLKLTISRTSSSISSSMPWRLCIKHICCAQIAFVWIRWDIFLFFYAIGWTKCSAFSIDRCLCDVSISIRRFIGFFHSWAFEIATLLHCNHFSPLFFSLSIQFTGVLLLNWPLVEILNFKCDLLGTYVAQNQLNGMESNGMDAVLSGQIRMQN